MWSRGQLGVKMSDIFISYARRESSIAKQLATALERKGFSIWWDHQIKAGLSWANEIENELAGAKCVIVLWSENSVNSEWVKEEASYARDLKKLIPVIVEDVEIPFGFHMLNSIELTDWNEDTSHPGFIQLVEALSHNLKLALSRNDDQMLTSS